MKRIIKNIIMIILIAELEILSYLTINSVKNNIKPADKLIQNEINITPSSKPHSEDRSMEENNISTCGFSITEIYLILSS